MQPNSCPWQSPLPSSSSLPSTCTTGQRKVAAWLQDSEEMDRCAEGQFLRGVGYQNKPRNRNKGELWVPHLSLPNLLDCLELYFLIFIHQTLLLPRKPVSSAPSQLLNLVSSLPWCPSASAFSPHLVTCSLWLLEPPLSLDPGRSAASGAPSTLTPSLSAPSLHLTCALHCIAYNKWQDYVVSYIHSYLLKVLHCGSVTKYSELIHSSLTLPSLSLLVSRNFLLPVMSLST